MQISSFIASEFYSSEKQFVKKDPFTGNELYRVSSCDLMGLVRAINAGNKAFADFRSSSIEDRIEIVKSVKNYIIEKRNVIALREAVDQAMPLKKIESYVVDASLSIIDQYLEEAEKQIEFSGSPTGLIAVISGWNFSFRIVMSKVVPAILAGNSVLIKVSSQSPSTALTLSEMLSELNLPPGLIQVLVTDDEDVKSMLISHPGVRALCFVGSLENGIKVLNRSISTQTQNFKKIQMCLGTKNTAVCIDEPDDQVFDSIMESFLLGQGQLAFNSARLFVLEKNEAAWVERLQNYLKSLRPSESVQDSSLWTPIIKEQSLQNFAGIKRQAFDDQAKLIEADSSFISGKSNYLPPIFTRDMSRCSTLQQDQIHCPFFILSTVKYPFDIAKYSNVSYFGFAAHLWGAHEKTAKIANSLEVGQINYNSWSAQQFQEAPAVKQSSYGIQDHRIFGLFYSNPKSLF